MRRWMDVFMVLGIIGGCGAVWSRFAVPSAEAQTQAEKDAAPRWRYFGRGEPGTNPLPQLWRIVDIETGVACYASREIPRAMSCVLLPRDSANPARTAEDIPAGGCVSLSAEAR